MRANRAETRVVLPALHTATAFPSESNAAISDKRPRQDEWTYERMNAFSVGEDVVLGGIVVYGQAA